MLKTSFSSWQRAVTMMTLLGICGSSAPLWAQETPSPFQVPSPSPRLYSGNPETVPVTPGNIHRFLLPIRNVKASLMAYWLDPEHHQTPIDVRYSQSLVDNGGLLRNMPRFPGNGNGPEGMKLPAGVVSIIPIDPQNSLIVTATDEGIKALGVLIATADIPLRQYEIETQFLQMLHSDLSKVGLDFGNPTEKSFYRFGAVTAVPSHFDVVELVRDRGVKIMSAPRVTVIDGLTGQLQQTTATPFVLDAELLKQQAQAKKATDSDANENTGVMPGVAYLTTTIGIRVTAIQDKAERIALAVTPTLESRSFTVTTSVRDGQSFAIQMSPPKDKLQVVAIVTLRKIRRVGDDDAVR